MRAAAPAVLLAFAVAACGGGDDDEPAAGSAAATVEPEGETVAEGKATGELTVWAMGAEGEKLSVLADMFKKENPEVTVTVTPIPWEVAHDKLLTSYAASRRPT
jgi:multiple sugar transport system substrate-binding protein